MITENNCDTLREFSGNIRHLLCQSEHYSNDLRNTFDFGTEFYKKVLNRIEEDSLTVQADLMLAITRIDETLFCLESDDELGLNELLNTWEDEDSDG